LRAKLKDPGEQSLIWDKMTVVSETPAMRDLRFNDVIAHPLAGYLAEPIPMDAREVCRD
jgi:hypothetical protein